MLAYSGGWFHGTLIYSNTCIGVFYSYVRDVADGQDVDIVAFDAVLSDRWVVDFDDAGYCNKLIAGRKFDKLICFEWLIIHG